MDGLPEARRRIVARNSVFEDVGTRNLTHREMMRTEAM